MLCIIYMYYVCASVLSREYDPAPLNPDPDPPHITNGISEVPQPYPEPNTPQLDPSLNLTPLRPRPPAHHQRHLGNALHDLVEGDRAEAPRGAQDQAGIKTLGLIL